MARTDLTVQSIAQAGIVPSYEAANAEGEAVPNNGQMFLHVKNGSGAEITVTLQTPVTYDGLALADQTVAVAAGAEKMIGTFSSRFNQASGTDKGKVYVDFSAVTSVTLAAFQL